MRSSDLRRGATVAMLIYVVSFVLLANAELPGVAVESRPTLRVARFNLGRMLIGLGRAADAIRVRAGARPQEVERRARERVEEAGVEALSRVDWESAVARGRAANVADVVATALAPPLTHPVTARP